MGGERTALRIFERFSNCIFGLLSLAFFGFSPMRVFVWRSVENFTLRRAPALVLSSKSP